jgi:1-deoxyxylulose-5-phosphate synthase
VQYTTLGSSGLKISRIALGCMSFGDTARGFNQWALDDKAAEPLFRQAVELGITFWDTANAYGYGTSEEIVGHAIRKYTRREDVVLATKVFFKMHDGPGGSGLSRRAIIEQLDDSLRRLGTDYVDLYQIHRIDPATPVEETMEALHDMVKAGKVRYLGASSMWAWQFSKMQYTADLHGWTRFVSMQNQYSLMQREEEREMFGLLADQGVGSIPWSPLAKGRLGRPWGEQTARSDTDDVARWVLPNDDKAIADAVVEDTGADVTSVNNGDPVIVPSAWCDGTCDFLPRRTQSSCRHGGFWNATESAVSRPKRSGCRSPTAPSPPRRSKRTHRSSPSYSPCRTSTAPVTTQLSRPASAPGPRSPGPTSPSPAPHPPAPTSRRPCQASSPARSTPAASSTATSPSTRSRRDTRKWTADRPSRFSFVPNERSGGLTTLSTTATAQASSVTLPDQMRTPSPSA